MSVLIRGMEMPESCGVCKLRTSVGCAAMSESKVRIGTGKREKWCPLVEVKAPHGRLIDEKDLSDRVLKWLPPDPCGKEELEYPIESDICVSLMMEIEESETVIESED